VPRHTRCRCRVSQKHSDTKCAVLRCPMGRRQCGTCQPSLPLPRAASSWALKARGEMDVCVCVCARARAREGERSGFRSHNQHDFCSDICLSLLLCIIIALALLCWSRRGGSRRRGGRRRAGREFWPRAAPHLHLMSAQAHNVVSGAISFNSAAVVLYYCTACEPAGIQSACVVGVSKMHARLHARGLGKFVKFARAHVCVCV
jgi:hypothetical protein